jgi:hypothetical protein
MICYPLAELLAANAAATATCATLNQLQAHAANCSAITAGKYGSALVQSSVVSVHERLGVVKNSPQPKLIFRWRAALSIAPRLDSYRGYSR